MQNIIGIVPIPPLERKKSAEQAVNIPERCLLIQKRKAYGL